MDIRHKLIQVIYVLSRNIEKHHYQLQKDTLSIGNVNVRVAGLKISKND